MCHRTGIEPYSISEVIRKWKRQDIGLPTTLKEVNVPKTDLAELVAFIVDDSQFTYGVPGNNPKKLTHENMPALFERMWEGHRLYANA